MEFVRKRLLSNEFHFGSVKKHKYFHIPKYVGTLYIRSLSVLHYKKGFLEKLLLDKDEAMAYDPHVVISKQRLENKNSTYEPNHRLDLVIIANKYSWEEVENIIKNVTASSDHNQVARQKRGE